MAAWDNLCLWLKDFISRGGDVLNLPSSSSLRNYRHSMVPSGLLCSTSSARIPLQNVLQHTAERILLRPDTQDFLDQLEDGTVLELLWKWGMDGQTGHCHYPICIMFVNLTITYICLLSLLICSGLAAYSRSKDHDDRQSLNEGCACLLVLFSIL